MQPLLFTGNESWSSFGCCLFLLHSCCYSSCVFSGSLWLLRIKLNAWKYHHDGLQMNFSHLHLGAALFWSQQTVSKSLQPESNLRSKEGSTNYYLRGTHFAACSLILCRKLAPRSIENGNGNGKCEMLALTVRNKLAGSLLSNNPIWIAAHNLTFEVSI